MYDPRNIAKLHILQGLNPIKHLLLKHEMIHENFDNWAFKLFMVLYSIFIIQWIKIKMISKTQESLEIKCAFRNNNKDSLPDLDSGRFFEKMLVKSKIPIYTLQSSLPLPLSPCPSFLPRET